MDRHFWVKTIGEDSYEVHIVLGSGKPAPHNTIKAWRCNGEQLAIMKDAAKLIPHR